MSVFGNQRLSEGSRKEHVSLHMAEKYNQNWLRIKSKLRMCRSADVETDNAVIKLQYISLTIFTSYTLP